MIQPNWCFALSIPSRGFWFFEVKVRADFRQKPMLFFQSPRGDFGFLKVTSQRAPPDAPLLNFQSPRGDFGFLKIGFWSDGHPAFHNRGTAFWVYRTKKGEIIIHKVHWSKWTTEDDEGAFFKFANLDEAATKFHRVLQNARVI